MHNSRISWFCLNEFGLVRLRWFISPRENIVGESLNCFSVPFSRRSDPVNPTSTFPKWGGGVNFPLKRVKGERRSLMCLGGTLWRGRATKIHSPVACHSFPHILHFSFSSLKSERVVRRPSPPSFS